MKQYAVFSKRGARGNCLTRLTQYPPLAVIPQMQNERVKISKIL